MLNFTFFLCYLKHGLMHRSVVKKEEKTWKRIINREDPVFFKSRERVPETFLHSKHWWGAWRWAVRWSYAKYLYTVKPDSFWNHIQLYAFFFFFCFSKDYKYHFYKLFWREVLVELEFSNWIWIIWMKLSVHLGIVEKVLSLACLSFFANNLAFNFL